MNRALAACKTLALRSVAVAIPGSLEFVAFSRYVGPVQYHTGSLASGLVA